MQKTVPISSLLWLLVLLAGCDGSVRPGSRAAQKLPRFESAPCEVKGVSGDWPAEQKVECGWLYVAETRGRAVGRVLKLWVAIARADAAHRVADPLLYIHGGPGLATVETRVPSFVKSPTWPLFRQHRDLIFFDQRGTGRSEPAFCPEMNEALNALQVEAPPARTELERTLAALSACREKLVASGLNVSAYNSAATADDAEDLRRVLGYASWNVYGVSYGTWVGLELLRRHPGGVRSVILDSPYPPNSAFWAEEQIHPTGKAYEAIDRFCRGNAECATRFPNIPGQLATVIRELDAQPIPRKGGRITGGAFLSALWALLVRTTTLPYVPLVIDQAAAGDRTATRRFVEAFTGPAGAGFGDYSHGQAMAVNCYESLAGRSEPAIREAIRRYPYLVGGDELPESQDRACDAWQPDRAPVETFAPVKSATPVLLVAGEFDPATPPEDAFQAARFLFNSTVVMVSGASHAPMNADECTRGIAQAFLAAPSARPDLGCLQKRPPFRFQTDGLDAFLDSQTKR